MCEKRFGANSVNMKILKTKCNQKCRDIERHYFRNSHTGTSVQEGIVQEEEEEEEEEEEDKEEDEEKEEEEEAEE